MRARHRLAACFAAGALIAASTSAPAQDSASSFRTRLLTVAFTPADGPFPGDGAATASVADGQIRIAGHYEGMGEPAMRVRILSGLTVGVPGDRTLAEMPVSGADASGTFAGVLPATADNLSLLRENRLYVQVDTQSAPDGALWGWLMEAHPFPGQNVPEKANPHAS